MKALLSNEVQRIRTSSLAHNAGWMLVGQGTNAGLLAVYFVILARVLGAREYGVFAGAFAFASIVTPYSALGSGLVFLRYVSTDADNFSAYWGNVLLSTLIMGSLTTLLVYFIAPHLLNHESASLILLVALGDCVCRQLIICSSQVFQAFEQLHMTALANPLTSLFRLLAAFGLLIFLHHATALQWAMLYLIGSAAAAFVGVAIVTKQFGPPQFVPKLFLAKLGEGLGFSFAGSTQSAYNDIDKTMLSHYDMNAANGLYTMAYRIVDVATIPIMALDAAALPRFFRQSQEGGKRVGNLSMHLSGRAALLGLIMAICLFLGAPLIPHIVGEGFRESIEALRWLCFLPVFRGIHQLTGSAVTGLGFQRYRTAAQFTAAVMNLCLNLWLIPRYGWLGAAWASLVTDGTLAVVNLSLLEILQGKNLEVTAV